MRLGVVGSVEVVVEPVIPGAGTKDGVPPVAWSRLAVAEDVGAELVTVEVPAEGGVRDCVPPVAASGGLAAVTTAEVIEVEVDPVAVPTTLGDVAEAAGMAAEAGTKDMRPPETLSRGLAAVDPVAADVLVAAATAEDETEVATAGGGSVCVWERDIVVLVTLGFEASFAPALSPLSPLSPKVVVVKVASILVTLTVGSGLGSRFTYFS